MTKTKTTDYVGNIIYENNALKRILVDGGYIEDGIYYFYLTDHLGNNRVVAKADGEIVQKNHYYPFGMAFAEGNINNQPYKYNGKELDRSHGLNHYDYSARYYNPDIPRFTTVDPRAEDYYSWSPYMYSYNNPIRFIDPDGEGVWEIIKGFAKGYHNAVVSANLPLSSNSPIGKIAGAVSTVVDVVKADPEQRKEIGKQIVTTIHEQSTLGLIEAGVTEYKAGGDGSKTSEKVGGVTANSLMEATVIVAAPGTISLTSSSTIGTEVANTTAQSMTRVGRWMSKSEYKTMTNREDSRRSRRKNFCSYRWTRCIQCSS